MFKRILSAVITVIILLFTFPVSVEASTVEYYIKEAGMTVSLPEEGAVFTRDMADDDPLFTMFGTTKTDIMNLFESQNIYLDMYNTDASSEMVVTITDNQMETINDIGDSFFEALLKTIKQQYEGQADEVLGIEGYTTDTTKFVLSHLRVGTTYSLICYTVANYKSVNLILQNYSSSPVSDQQIASMKQILDSVVFDRMEQGDIGKPINYSNSEPSVSFTVPSGWTKLDLSGNGDIPLGEEFFDWLNKLPEETSIAGYFKDDKSITFVTGFDRSFMIYFGNSTDSITLKVALANIVGVSSSDLKSVKYNNESFFMTEKTALLNLPGYDGVQYETTLTNAILVKNGWIIWFMYTGSEGDTYFGDFESVLNSFRAGSLLLPPISISEPTVPEPTKETETDSAAEETETEADTNAPVDTEATNDEAESVNGPLGMPLLILIIAVLVLTLIIVGVVSAIVISGKKKKAAKQNAYVTGPAYYPAENPGYVPNDQNRFYQGGYVPPETFANPVQPTANAPEETPYVPYSGQQTPVYPSNDPQQVVFCQKCGCRIYDNSRFCPGCGADLQNNG